MSDEERSLDSIVASVILVVIAIVSLIFLMGGLARILGHWEEIRVLAELDPTRGRIDVIIEELPGAFLTSVIGGFMFFLSIVFLAIID